MLGEAVAIGGLQAAEMDAAAREAEREESRAEKARAVAGNSSKNGRFPSFSQNAARHRKPISSYAAAWMSISSLSTARTRRASGVSADSYSRHSS